MRNCFVVKNWEMPNWFVVKNRQMRNYLLFYANFRETLCAIAMLSTVDSTKERAGINYFVNNSCFYYIDFYSCTRYKLLCDYNSCSSSDTGSEEV